MRQLFFLVLTFFFLISNFCSQNANAQVPTNGLLGEWLLNNSIDNKEGLTNYQASLENGCHFTTDRFGNENYAVEFDGVDDLLALPFGNSLATLSTISFWVYINGNNLNNPSLTKQAIFKSGTIYLYWSEPEDPYNSNTLLGMVLDGSYSQHGFWSDDNSIFAQNWYHVVITSYSTNDLFYHYIYINGT